MRIFALVFLFSTGILAADTPPFANLNQYYKYKNIDNSSFEINNILYSADNFIVTRTNAEVQLTIQEVSPFRSSLTQIEILDTKLKKIKALNIEPAQNEFNQKIQLDPKKTGFICIVGKNEFTTKKMCKKIPEFTAKEQEKIAGENLIASANGIPLSPYGQIILNEKDSSLIFRVEKSNFFFELITRNKNIVINRAYKFEKSNTIQTEFIDLNHPSKYRFKRKIELTDTFFEINYDDLLTVYQDIVFLEADLFKKAVDYEFKGYKKYNKLGIEPIGLYSQLIVESSFLRARIVSDLSKGVKLYLAQYLDSNIEYHYSGKLTLLHMRDDINRNTISNNTLNLFSLEGSARYFQSPVLHYDLGLSLEESVFAEGQPNSGLLNIIKTLSPRIKFSVNYILLEIQKWRLQASAAGDLIGPASTPGGQTQIALGLSLASMLSYKLRAGRIYYGADFSSYSTSNSIYKYNYQSLEHSVGFYYLF